MYVIGEAKGIKIHSPEDAYFSYFNSPYTGHAHAAAIDIYPYHQEWGGPVASPVSGKIVRLQKFRMGRKKEFPTEDFDYGTEEWAHQLIPNWRNFLNVALQNPIDERKLKLTLKFIY